MESKGCKTDGAVLWREPVLNQCAETNEQLSMVYNLTTIPESIKTVFSSIWGQSFINLIKLALINRKKFENYFYWVVFSGLLFTAYLIFEAFVIGISSALTIEILTKEYLHLVDENVSPQLQEWFEIQKAFSQNDLKILKNTRQYGKHKWIYKILNSEIGNFMINLSILVLFMLYIFL